MIMGQSQAKVYLVTGYTDMRKAIGGLSVMVQAQLELDPFSGHLFVFCNRKQNNIKILYWDVNGFCLGNVTHFLQTFSPAPWSHTLQSSHQRCR